MAAEYKVPGYIVYKEPHDGMDFTEKELNIGLRYLLDNNVELKRGDLISFESAETYRNDGLCIFDGQKIINLQHRTDEYGHLPSQFKLLTEFPLDYFHGKSDRRRIVHNTTMWLDMDTFREQMLENVRFDDELTKDGEYMMYTSIKHDGKTYYIVLFDEIGSDEPKIENFREIINNNNNIAVQTDNAYIVNPIENITCLYIEDFY